MQARSNQYASVFTNLHEEVKTLENSSSLLQDQYGYLAGRIEHLQRDMMQAHQEETSSLERIFLDTKLLLEEKIELAETVEKLEGQLQESEANLEEERSKSIMLSEKASKLEQEVRPEDPLVDSLACLFLSGLWSSVMGSSMLCDV